MTAVQKHNVNKNRRRLSAVTQVTQLSDISAPYELTSYLNIQVMLSTNRDLATG